MENNSIHPKERHIKRLQRLAGQRVALINKRRAAEVAAAKAKKVKP